MYSKNLIRCDSHKARQSTDRRARGARGGRLSAGTSASPGARERSATSQWLAETINPMGGISQQKIGLIIVVVWWFVFIT